MKIFSTFLFGQASGQGDEAGSVELSPHITAELDKDGELIGIEITDATAYVRDNILESAQARLLHGKKDA